MKYSLKNSSPEKITCDCLVLPVWQNSDLTAEGSIVDTASEKTISKILACGDFDGKLEEVLMLHELPGVKSKRVLLMGLGDKKKFTAKNARKVLTKTLNTITSGNSASAHFDLTSLKLKDRDASWLLSRIAQEAEDICYRYDETRSKKCKACKLKSISVAAPSGSRKAAVTTALQQGSAIGKAINHCKQLGNLPGNICTPSYLAKQATELAGHSKDMTTKVLSEKQMEKLGMGSLLSVSAGSHEEAKLIVMEYKGAPAGKKDSKPYVLVGKGITFDTGGISLKPGLGMDEMKYDMCGAASVLATMGCVAELKLPINVVGIIASAENMPGSKATKPGDIVTSMSGKTIEILNTDAEGRLVLCDALTYAERFKPKSVIDIATLTGAAVATFGSFITALLSNKDSLGEELKNRGEQCLDPVWELPLWDEYQSLLDSNFADIANIGGPRAGTITAACFLSRFTKKYAWAHLDIAGSAWNSGTKKGSTGRPVPLLMEYLLHQKA